MNLDLKNRTALVCGASQGLGAAVANELAVLGANVIVLARNENKLQQVVKDLAKRDGQHHYYITADTSKTELVKEKVQQFLEKHGAIHILVNNSGGPPSAPMIETNPADLETAFQSHLITAHVLAQLVFEGMRADNYGRIVNIVSTSVKQPINGLGISNTVRAAVANWGKSLANELGQYGITVNNVLPGYTKTDRLDYLFSKQAANSHSTVDEIIMKNVSAIPAGRLGEPDEFAAVVAFLCTPAAAYINGINLPVDGGRIASL